MQSIRSRPPARTSSLPLPEKKPWGGLSGSVIAHAVVILLLFGLTRGKSKETRDPSLTSAEAVPVQMVYLPIAPQRLPAPAAAPETSRPAPDAVHGDRPEEAQSTDPNEDAPPAPAQEQPREETPELARETPPPVRRPPVTESEPRPETLEEQSQRLFGRPQLRRDQQEAQTQLGIHPGAESDRDRAERTTCVPKPRDPNAPLQMVQLVGRIFNENSRPLAGAFLQILGTSYSTYSDRTGMYRLVFDASLVDECRTQYVRVVAEGYRGRNLVLGVGPGVNDVVMNR
jgi:hypothetical protein